ncbi:PE-PGRS family protein [Streptomyces sp. S.PB5]|uniref:PE-PGRS family protein n=1 Tax=Streptomyces sp. S.PB5 TaxID=3020844 RepID=UPI0025AF2063|nr:PE-PGRS family protein [Streptomyces sp. S.PB5]MDN3021734.1 PE-PGRS family protein [Streptomyces sp. S.PB5]
MAGGCEHIQQLERAGLEIAADQQIEEVLPVPFARRYVVEGEAEPTVKVRSERSDLADEVNAQWYRLASEAGILGADGVFLVDVGCSSRRWVRVRLGAAWDLAGALGERPGRPEFLTLSPDGDALVGATSGERDVRLVAVDRVKARQEEAAQAAGRETAQERAAAWETLFSGPGPAKALLESWADGLSLNPATPAELRPLLASAYGSSYAIYGRLPTESVDALLDDPEWKTRLRAVEHQKLTPGQWARVIAGEESERHRWILTMVAADHRVELTEDTCRRLAADPSARVRSEAARLTALPVDLALTLTADPDGSVRATACQTAWPRLDACARELLLADPHGVVRARARLLHHQEHPMPRPVFEAVEVSEVRTKALETCLLERELAEHLVRHGEYQERRALAENPRLDLDLVLLLAEDPDAYVRSAVAQRADLTEEQRAAVDFEFDPKVHYWDLDWVVALHEDEDAMRRLAASAHPLVRRSVARARRLPPDVVERLARDEDRVVQLFLAESCDDAPADMLLSVWKWWDGSLTAPDRPRGHPNFPRHGLLRYADDPSPRMRRLALDDPESTPELVERLSRDPSKEVRYRAATDPRLSAAAAARLLQDPHEDVRHAAALHPQLPARLLVWLLRGGGPETAARNPALPEEVIRRMAGTLAAGADG